MTFIPTHPWPAPVRVKQIRANSPSRLGERPHPFVGRVHDRCRRLPTREAIRRELEQARAVFKREFGEVLDVTIDLENGEVIR